MSWFEFVLPFAVCFAVSAASWGWGYVCGVAVERNRVTNLLYAPFRQGRMSQTLRWVLNAVTSGERQLPPKELFFPPEDQSKS